MVVFNMAFKCVLKILKTYVNFTGLQEENYFCSRKMLISRKLKGVETFLSVSFLFQINDNIIMCTANSEHSDSISRSNTHQHTQAHIIFIYIYIHIYIYIYIHTHTHTHTHTYIYIYIFENIYWNSSAIFRLRYLQLHAASSQSAVDV